LMPSSCGLTVKSRACRIAKEAAKERAKMEAEKEKERANMEEKRAKEEVQLAVPCRPPLPTHVLMVHRHTETAQRQAQTDRHTETALTGTRRQAHRDKHTETGTQRQH
jgi:hypothetical protein